MHLAPEPKPEHYTNPVDYCAALECWLNQRRAQDERRAFIFFCIALALIVLALLTLHTFPSPSGSL